MKPAFQPEAEPPVFEQKLKPESKPSPNLWLKAALSAPPIRHDWFACLVYSKLAERFGSSKEGRLGPSACWAIAMSEVEDIAADDFKGIFLTEKGGFGFLDHGHVARFNKGVAFIGTLESALEGIDIILVGVGLDSNERIILIVNDGYHAKFGVPETAIRKELAVLSEHGAELLSVTEALERPKPIEVVWTVPAEQKTAGDPQAVENVKPA